MHMTLMRAHDMIYPMVVSAPAGGAYKDAIGVCAHEMQDPQLALFLARLLEGEQGPLQQSLICQDLLPGLSSPDCPQHCNCQLPCSPMI